MLAGPLIGISRYLVEEGCYFYPSLTVANHWRPVASVLFFDVISIIIGSWYSQGRVKNMRGVDWAETPTSQLFS